ncbi:hypothetical protein BJ508DRAFT_414771 [Ascobolus immersus RN42]|uniref:Uncharacterized protein n=1 Tax=Ascobolus immersus RN42 TaxID=1160509 RepID=A0A3N4IB00_ASCIM|nr:hypothetical protein BJ508DRAFT_414771 [Ascobolus immersus RN42]
MSHQTAISPPSRNEYLVDSETCPPAPSSKWRHLPPFFFVSSQINAAKEVAKELVQQPSKMASFQRTKARGFVCKEYRGKQHLVRAWGRMDKTVEGYLYYTGSDCEPLDYADRTTKAAVRMGSTWTLLVADVELDDGRMIQATCVCLEPERAAALFGKEYL